MSTSSDQESLYKSLGLDPTKVTTHEDGTISYDGSVFWDNKTFKVFPLKFRKVTGNFYCRECANLVSLEGAPQEVDGNFFCSGCTSLVSLKGGPLKVANLDLEGTHLSVIPEDLEITGRVWLGGSNNWVPTDKARNILQEFKSSITSDEDAAEVLLDRMNRPLWQVAYATDYLNKDLRV